MLLPDRTDDAKLINLVRIMRHYNFVPCVGGGSSGQLKMKYIIEDPYMKDLVHSYIIQLVDVNVYFLHQKLKPNSYMRKKKADTYFMRLDNVLLKKLLKSADGVKKLNGFHTKIKKVQMRSGWNLLQGLALFQFQVYWTTYRRRIAIGQ